ncbi:hypothetical protein E4K67_29210 [Desulfosporosinus fructosivorans]|uniref:Cation/H+ exchanger transmembrane domain-containing protein n=1 Tax=Desulfosporosinus fructosivorans TaxID=2018669 RepID=A0A4Z0QXN3_9FIRM|nr:hypothetical protein E4K67_29210 [Desulfosporosinus fructosivorans]
MIVGIIIGKSGFNLIQGSDWLNFLYNLGFAFLMFMAGIKIDFDLIISLAKAKKQFTLDCAWINRIWNRIP